MTYEDYISESKMCPLMIGTEEYKAVTYGQGDYIVPIMYPCIGEKCMAYEKNGTCYWLKTTKSESEDAE